MGRGAVGTGREWQWGGGQCEEEMERGAMGKGATGRGERRKRWGGGDEGVRGVEISQMDMMGCLGGHRL